MTPLPMLQTQLLDAPLVDRIVKRLEEALSRPESDLDALDPVLIHGMRRGDLRAVPLQQLRMNLLSSMVTCLVRPQEPEEQWLFEAASKFVAENAPPVNSSGVQGRFQ